MNVCQRVAPWNTEVKAGPSISAISSGRSASRSTLMISTDANSTPPTSSTGTRVRSARASVAISKAGNSR